MTPWTNNSLILYTTADLIVSLWRENPELHSVKWQMVHQLRTGQTSTSPVQAYRWARIPLPFPQDCTQGKHGKNKETKHSWHLAPSVSGAPDINTSIIFFKFIFTLSLQKQLLFTHMVFTLNLNHTSCFLTSNTQLMLRDAGMLQILWSLSRWILQCNCIISNLLYQQSISAFVYWELYSNYRNALHILFVETVASWGVGTMNKTNQKIKIVWKHKQTLAWNCNVLHETHNRQTKVSTSSLHFSH